MPSHDQREGHWACKPCKRFFASFEALAQHKKKMRDSGALGHIHCKHCGMDFKTQGAEMTHIRQYHPQEQNLVCPACEAGPFARIAAFMAHIEQGECTQITPAVIDDLREKKTQFSRSLFELTGEPLKKSFAQYINPSLATISARAEAAIRASRPSVAVSWDSLAKEEPWSDDWSDKKKNSVAVTSPSWIESKLYRPAVDPDVVDWTIGKKSTDPGPVHQKKDDKKSFWAVDPTVTDWSIKQDKAPARSIWVADPTVTDWTIVRQLPAQPHAPEESTQGESISESCPAPTSPIVKRDAAAEKSNGHDPLAWFRMGVADWLRGNIPPVQESNFQSSTRGSPLNGLNPKTEKDLPAQESGYQDPWALMVPEENVDTAARTQRETVFNSMDPDHPDHPSFSVAKYYNPWSQGWGCPKKPCLKVFKSARGLIGHLRSPAHGDTRYQCPYCLKYFTSLTSIVSHTEQSSVRCLMRDSDNYDAFIYQLTGGIVEVKPGRHEDGTVIYGLTKDWKEPRRVEPGTVETKPTIDCNSDDFW